MRETKREKVLIILLLTILLLIGFGSDKGVYAADFTIFCPDINGQNVTLGWYVRDGATQYDIWNDGSNIETISDVTSGQYITRTYNISDLSRNHYYQVVESRSDGSKINSQNMGVYPLTLEAGDVDLSVISYIDHSYTVAAHTSLTILVQDGTTVNLENARANQTYWYVNGDVTSYYRYFYAYHVPSTYDVDDVKTISTDIGNLSYSLMDGDNSGITLSWPDYPYITSYSLVMWDSQYNNYVVRDPEACQDRSLRLDRNKLLGDSLISELSTEGVTKATLIGYDAQGVEYTLQVIDIYPITLSYYHREGKSPLLLTATNGDEILNLTCVSQGSTFIAFNSPDQSIKVDIDPSMEPGLFRANVGTIPYVYHKDFGYGTSFLFNTDDMEHAAVNLDIYARDYINLGLVIDNEGLQTPPLETIQYRLYNYQGSSNQTIDGLTMDILELGETTEISPNVYEFSYSPRPGYELVIYEAEGYNSGADVYYFMNFDNSNEVNYEIDDQAGTVIYKKSVTSSNIFDHIYSLVLDYVPIEGYEWPTETPEDDTAKNNESEDSATPAPKVVTTYYTLKITTTEGGSVPGFEGTHSFSSGTHVNLSPVAEDGYTFAGYTGDTSSLEGDVVIMNGDVELVAEFDSDLGSVDEDTISDEAAIPEAAPDAISEADSDQIQQENQDEATVLDELTPLADGDEELPTTAGIPLWYALLMGSAMIITGLLARNKKEQACK